MKIARNILLVLEAVLLVAVFAYEVYIVTELAIEGGWAALGWVIMLIVFAIASVILLVMGIVATVLTAKLNKAYYNPVNIEADVETKKYSMIPGILGIALPIVTLLLYFFYPVIFIN